MEVRKLVISLVLATDMATHFGHLATLKNYGSVRIVDAARLRHSQRAGLRRRRGRAIAFRPCPQVLRDKGHNPFVEVALSHAGEAKTPRRARDKPADEERAGESGRAVDLDPQIVRSR
jgi:hypothetical protein